MLRRRRAFPDYPAESVNNSDALCYVCRVKTDRYAENPERWPLVIDYGFQKQRICHIGCVIKATDFYLENRSKVNANE